MLALGRLLDTRLTVAATRVSTPGDRSACLDGARRLAALLAAALDP
jgi:hypothetical protein